MEKMAKKRVWGVGREVVNTVLLRKHFSDVPTVQRDPVCQVGGGVVALGHQVRCVFPVEGNSKEDVRVPLVF